MSAASVSTRPAASISSDKTPGARRLGRANLSFKLLTLAAAIAIVAVFIGMFIALLKGAWPALTRYHLDFLTTVRWDPVDQEFGILAQIYGTLITSVIAMAIAAPIGIGVAIFLTELCPRFLSRPIAIGIELLAGIPSIIFGVWGLFVFAPVFQRSAQPFIIDLLAGIPILSTLFAGPPYGMGVFTAGVILAIMILPLVSAITRDVFDIVPNVLKESAYAIGCTKWEVIWHVVLPYTRAGVVGGAMLALGRALGETMAVTFVIGNAHKISASIFAPGTSISAAIANEFSEAVEEIYQSSLLAGGLFLLFITFIVLAAAQFMLGRVATRAGH